MRYAKSFADFVDFSVWEKYISDETPFELPYQERKALVLKADEQLSQSIVRAFSWKYLYPGGENLPVKSSATALLKEAVGKPREFAEEYFSVPVLFDEEDETGSEIDAESSPSTTGTRDSPDLPITLFWNISIFCC